MPRAFSTPALNFFSRIFYFSALLVPLSELCFILWLVVTVTMCVYMELERCAAAAAGLVDLVCCHYETMQPGKHQSKSITSS